MTAKDAVFCVWRSEDPHVNKMLLGVYADYERAMQHKNDLLKQLSRLRIYGQLVSVTTETVQ